MILMYHKTHPESPTMWWVTPNAFWRQMDELRRYEVVYLDDYDPANPKNVVITFDGVYENVYTYALPILEKFGYPFELFVVGSTVGQGNEFDQPVEPPARFADTKQLKALVSGGGRLQWHSLTHADLSKFQDIKIFEQELAIPEEIKRIDSKGFTWFAYPHGRHPEPLIEYTKQFFKGAVSCVEGNDFDQYQLNRLTVTNETSFRKSTVSLIIPNYNYGRFLEEAIESALCQTVLPDEILFIDDHSSDNSMELVEKYKARIKIVRNEENLGIVGNFNKAVSLTTGEYVCFLGADNRFRSDYVEKCKFALDSHPDAAIAYTNVFLFGPLAAVWAKKFGGKPFGDTSDDFIWEVPEFSEEVRDNLHKKNVMHGSSMFRRAAFEEAGRYLDTQGPEDQNLFARILGKGWNAVLCPDYLLEYRQHSPKQDCTQRIAMMEFANMRRSLQDKEASIAQLETAIQNNRSEIEKLKADAEVYKNEFSCLKDAYHLYIKLREQSADDTEVRQEVEQLSNLLRRFGDAKMLFPQIKKIIEESLPLKSNNTISINIESVEQHKRYFAISGWAFINGEDSVNSKISIILKSEKNCFVVETWPVKRPDVTSFFHTLNYDDSGFSALISNTGLEDGEYKIIIYITKGSIKAYHETDEKIVIKSDPIVREPKEAEPIHPKCSDEDTKSLESKSIHKQEEDEYVQEIEKIFSTFSTGAIENKSLKSLLGELSDDFWFWLFTAGYENDILKRIFPKMPDPDIQVQYTGRSGYLALEQAFSAYKLFKRILREHSKDINFCDKVLDFGCGWGRIIRFFLKDVEASGLYGVDCFKGIIDLCKTQNLRCNFEVVNAMPPTHFDSDTFDLIYLYSVFSHLSEKAHLEWLNEFRRIMKPTGMLIATTRPRSFIKLCADLRRQKDLASWQRGAAASFKDPEKALVDYDSGKFVHSPTSGSGVLNDSFYGESCIPKKYVEENWIKYFSQIGYIYVEEHKSFDQDVIFAKK